MAELDLTIDRSFAAPPGTVFRLWSDADLRRRWWAPQGFVCAEFTHDFRAGGNWQARLEPTGPGVTLWMGGGYAEIRAPTLIRFSFAWLENGTAAGDRSTITVRLAADGAGTRMRFSQTPFVSAPTRDSHVEGWSECLDRLEAVIAGA